MFSIRVASLEDIPTIVEISASTLRETTRVAPVHTTEQVFDYYNREVFATCTVLVAEVGQAVVGYVGYRLDWLDHLRVYSKFQGHGIGTALLEKAKKDFAFLQLLCFQHIPARYFYRKHGFSEVAYSDGHNNDEKLPDVRMQWRRGPP